MNTVSLLEEAGIFRMIAKCRRLEIQCKWFVFGSVMRGEYQWSDIDILCLVEDLQAYEHVRAECDEYLLCAPIDLRILLASDEHKLRFVERTSATVID